MVAFGLNGNENGAGGSSPEQVPSKAGAAAVAPIAVIGMACRLPGGIDSPELLWDALLRGDDLITEVPSDRWSIDDHYDPEPGTPGRSVSKWGAFLDDVVPLMNGSHADVGTYRVVDRILVGECSDGATSTPIIRRTRNSLSTAATVARTSDRVCGAATWSPSSRPMPSGSA